jgi:hypothetical protein
VIRMRLPETDRERLGLPEWIEFDPASMMLSEAEALQEEFDIDPWDFAGVLRGTPVTGPGGEPVLVDGKPRMRQDMRAWRFVVWAAARRAGCTVSLKDFDVNVLGMRTAPQEPEPEAAAGDPKDPSTPEPPSGESGSGSGS